MFDAAIMRNAVQVALVVGVLLNIVNHGEVMISGGEWPWGSMILNFAIPFLVSLYSGGKVCRTKSIEARD